MSWLRAHGEGMDILGATQVEVVNRMPAWQVGAVLAGALASMATLWMAFTGRRR